MYGEIWLNKLGGKVRKTPEVPSGSISFLMTTGPNCLDDKGVRLEAGCGGSVDDFIAFIFLNKT
ncbi:hypothetical protein BJP41_06780 [Candidatus Williamhamiltonella defendens]|uniref:Uncharacterized protein n=1 Tax=Candidatus Williamhamiltonella defendens TaxID=138072 RepID=A0A2D3T2Q5_9ENTR|nr:hypothetical protein BJP41_06780 [Candidatus Hamiltonella defensa]